MSDDPALVLNEVSKRFASVLAVDAITMQVPRGTVHGFVGPNGSGKTTTLRMILDVLRPDGGSIRVLGEDLPGAAADRVGYLPEERGLYRKMSALRVIRYYAGLKGHTGAGLKQRALDWLERLGLADRANVKVEALSKGMQQKVQLIATLITEPELVILDEPFSGLDPVNQEVIREEMLRIAREGRTLVFCTHDMRAAEEMCATVSMISKGRLVLDGPLAEIRRREGREILRIDLGPDARFDVSRLPGVTQVRDVGNVKELAFEGETQPILKALAEEPGLSLRRFEIAEPTLHDIFIRLAGDALPAPTHS